MNNSNTLASLFFLSLLCLSPIYSQVDDYSKVKVRLSSNNDIQVLNDLDLDIDHFQSFEENTIEFVINHEEMTVLDAAGFSYEVLIPDLRAFHKRRALADQQVLPSISRSSRTADHFGYGSMGGFYTLEEIEAKLDEMSTDFPTLATAKFSIGTSNEGRDIWAVKISDNPNIDEEEDVVYYDALHHAREPLSMAVTINYAFWLLENYETDDQIKYIIDNRELYFVPCVNPDGYEYNRETDPNGGGYWRKNRRLNPNGCYGVDLNRNYSFGYANNNFCSSTNPCSNTYRGTDSFSEPEANAVKDFLSLINPNTAFSTHSTAGSCLMPYGFDTSPPDFDIYSEWASDFLSENDYPYGVTFQMLGYTSCGTTRDYLHSEDIYCWTPEIDGSGFWPNQSEIFALVDENVYPMLYQAWIAGQYTDIQSHEITGDVLPGESLQMTVEVKNKGVGMAFSNVEVQVVATNPMVTITGDGNLGVIDARKKSTTSDFTISLDPLFSPLMLGLKMIVSQDGVEVDSETILIPTGQKNILFEDHAEAGVSNWTSTGNGIPWGLNSDDSYNGEFSFGDSNNGNSQNNTNNFFTLNSSIDLNTAESPMLEFYSKWSLEDGDVVNIQVSKTNGLSWSNIKVFADSEPWHQELIDLKQYIGSNIQLRFQLSTDGNIPADGFYFDQISISDYNCCPTSTHEIGTSSVSIYPNPANTHLKVALSQYTNVQIELFDITGKRIRSVKADSTVELDLQDLVPNTYFIKVLDLKSGQMITDKIIKM